MISSDRPIVINMPELPIVQCKPTVPQQAKPELPTIKHISTNIINVRKTKGMSVIQESEEHLDEFALRKLKIEDKIDTIQKIDVNAGCDNVSVNKDYTIGKIIGKGSYCEVSQAFHRRTKENHVVQQVNLVKEDKFYRKWILEEINNLKFLDHPNIVQIHEHYLDKDNNLSVILENCGGQNLKEFRRDTKRFTSDECGDIFAQIVRAVYYMHQNNILHRDLRLENFMVINFNEDKSCVNKKTVVKICDFDTSTKLNSEIQVFSGVQEYSSPESLKLQPQTEKSEIWTLGVILFYLRTGEYPFKQNYLDKKSIVKKIMTADYKYPENPLWDHLVHEQQQELIKSMLQVNPNKRITTEQLLNHPWIVQHLPNKKHCCEFQFDRLKQNVFRIDGFANQTSLGVMLYDLYVKRMVPLEEKMRSYKMFNKLDKTSRGKLTLEEIDRELPNFVEYDKEDFEHFISTLEYMHDYTIDYQLENRFNIKDKKEKSKWFCCGKTRTADKSPIPEIKVNKSDIPDIGFEEIIIDINRKKDEKEFFIKYSEFVTYTVDKEKVLNAKRIKDFFRLFDRKGKKKITAIDIVKVFDKKVNIKSHKWDSYISEAVNGEDRKYINLKDFSKQLWNGQEPGYYKLPKW